MNPSTRTIVLTGVVPPVCDSEAGHEQLRLQKDRSIEASSNDPDHEQTDISPDGAAPAGHGFPAVRLGALIKELCIAVRSALDNERVVAEECLRRASEILDEFHRVGVPPKETGRGGLAPWQIRKVASYVEAHLGRSIRNEDLAALVRLNPSHFGRAFRNSFGEPPHEYVMRRRVERAQGLMLSTGASLADIALDCGLADQSHLTRLFRRIVGESPRAWRRARISAPV